MLNDAVSNEYIEVMWRTKNIYVVMKACSNAQAGNKEEATEKLKQLPALPLLLAPTVRAQSVAAGMDAGL